MVIGCIKIGNGIDLEFFPQKYAFSKGSLCFMKYLKHLQFVYRLICHNFILKLDKTAMIIKVDIASLYHDTHYLKGQIFRLPIISEKAPAHLVLNLII